MDTPTAPSDWRTVLREQGRTLRWLALNTGKSPRTVYAYSRGSLPTPTDWLTTASAVLGVPVVDTLVVTVTRQFTNEGDAA